MKYLLKLKKFGKSTFISHNDTLEELERMFRRAKIEMEYTQGFHAKPKLAIQDFSNFNKYVSEGFRLMKYGPVKDNYKLNIKYYLFRVYISENLFSIFEKSIENDEILKNKFIDLEYKKNKKGIYVLKYKQEYNKIYNIWKVFKNMEEDFIFFPFVYDVIWGG
ncbi:MAG: hypothetical protein B6I29_01425 [Marinitoga sp. 4572_148]|nr:MAG: hypothetical protein B6I29_01425 [Marinitoga sp. 4572_148]